MNPEMLSAYVDDRAGEGRFTVRRDIFTDPEIFELEMRYIFGRTWVFLGLASQVPHAHDYLSTFLGRQPVLVMRSADGQLGAFYNTCRHRGALVCHTEKGNARAHVCHYHGWAYDSSGRNIDIKERKNGDYAAAFDEDSHDLQPVAAFANYRGFLFGSASALVPPIEEHLGGARKFLDLVVDQSPDGVELVPGNSVYTFRANWKLQIENCSDVYHLTSTHRSFLAINEQRRSGESKHKLRTVDSASWRSTTVERGSFTFPHGHAVVWGENPTPEIRPLYAQVDALKARVGEETTRWMLGSNNLTVYPNMQLANNAAMLMRVIRPLAVDRTEMRLYCVAPVGEAPDVREYRIRQFEDFYNATGMATPDDNVTYEDCQDGYAAASVPWQQGYARGLAQVRGGGDARSRELGIEPDTSIGGNFSTGDETVFHSGYREWVRLMTRGAAAKGARA